MAKRKKPVNDTPAPEGSADVLPEQPEQPHSPQGTVVDESDVGFGLGRYSSPVKTWLKQQAAQGQEAQAQPTNGAPTPVPEGTLTTRYLYSNARVARARCDLPGYEGLTVWYDVTRSWGELMSAMTEQNIDSYLKALSVLVVRFEGWESLGLYDHPVTRNPIPPPDPQKPQSYAILATDALNDLLLWLLRDGFRIALDNYLKNSSRTQSARTRLLRPNASGSGSGGATGTAN